MWSWSSQLHPELLFEVVSTPCEFAVLEYQRGIFLQSPVGKVFDIAEITIVKF